MKLATAAQMRELDRQAIQERKIPSIDLMERAAEGVAEAALELLPLRPGKCRAAVFCGTGNNGGDGIAAARLLFLKGVRVRDYRPRQRRDRQAARGVSANGRHGCSGDAGSLCP